MGLFRSGRQLGPESGGATTVDDITDAGDTGKQVLRSENADAARTVLELGSAATKNVGNGHDDVMAAGSFGLGVGPVAKTDAYSNIGQFFRINAASDNKPATLTGNIAAGVLSLPCDAAPSTGYFAVDGMGNGWIGRSGAVADGVTWYRLFSEKYKPAAADIRDATPLGQQLLQCPDADAVKALLGL